MPPHPFRKRIITSFPYFFLQFYYTINRMIPDRYIHKTKSLFPAIIRKILYFMLVYTYTL